MDWPSKFKENKWAFVAYTGSNSFKCTTRWYTVQATKWELVRYNLEAFGPEEVERDAMGHRSSLTYDKRPHQNTILRAYEAFRPMRPLDAPEKFPVGLKKLLNSEFTQLKDLEILTGDRFLVPNTFVFVVRSPMPLGGRAYVPILEKGEYALLEEALKSRPNDEGLLKKQQDLRSRYENAFHAADKITCVHHYKKEFQTTYAIESVSTSTEYLKPPMEYLCEECNVYGLHYTEACYLWPKKPKTLELKWGPKRFQPAKETANDDALFYNLLFKKVNKTRP